MRFMFLYVGILFQNFWKIRYDPQSQSVKRIEEIILDYVDKVDPNEYDAVKSELQDIKDEWDISATGSLVYTSHKNEKKLLKGDTENSRFRTMSSMRSVDVQAGIYLLGR